MVQHSPVMQDLRNVPRVVEHRLFDDSLDKTFFVSTSATPSHKSVWWEERSDNQKTNSDTLDDYRRRNQVLRGMRAVQHSLVNSGGQQHQPRMSGGTRLPGFVSEL